LSITNKAAPIGLAVLLACLSMLSPFSIDTFFPSFRSMQAEFSVTALQMQQTLTFYLLPYAIMSLFHGPISDAVGRRPVVLVGLGFYAAASLACSLAPGFASLITFRMMQGISAGTGMVVSRAVVRDLYQGAAAQRLISVMTMIFGVAPAVAPVIGGWVHVWFGWRAVFMLLTVLALILLTFSYLQLPETHPPEKRIALDVKTLVRGSWRVATDPVFALLALASGLSLSAMLVFVASAPAIVMDHWKLSETQFGYLFIPMISGMVSGAWVSGRFAGRIGPKQQVLLGFSLELIIAAAAATAQCAMDRVPVPLQQLGLAGIAFSFQLAAPVLMLAMLDRFPEVRGTAASVQGFIMLIITSTVMGLISPRLYFSMLYITSFGGIVTALAILLWYAAMHAGPKATRYRP
jgi:DHA1 family bicyclomycin/chloramphenicol resistance-like MFS transporter